MSDGECAFFAPFVIETGPRRGRQPRDHRLVLDGVFWIVRTDRLGATYMVTLASGVRSTGSFAEA